MHDDPIERLWRSPANEPDAETRAALIGEARATLARRRARLTALLVFAGAALALQLALLALSLVPGMGVDLEAMWALAPLTIIPMLALVFIALRRSKVSAGASLKDMVRALAAENAAARARVLVMGAALLVFAPFLFVALRQLLNTGKLAPSEMTSAMIVLFGALALSASWIVANYFLRLRPDGQRLAALNRQYEQAP
jgi:hypothetical protein